MRRAPALDNSRDTPRGGMRFRADVLPGDRNADAKTRHARGIIIRDRAFEGDDPGAPNDHARMRTEANGLAS